ncbi:CD48 protein, partial [Mohoua ochrocephala]|nr:CD48 protein [Mohoua ochrocephala]
EFRGGRSSRTAPQHRGGAQPPATRAPLAGRALLRPSDGSLVLKDVQESGSGSYGVSTGGRRSLESPQEALQPVPHPRLRASSLVARASGRIVCEVAEHRVDITWKKDGQPLPPDRVPQLRGNHSVLHLRAARRSDCGSYSCNTSDGVSWRETSLSVTVEGLA